VLDADAPVVGIVTDRDACMAAFTKGRRRVPVVDAGRRLVGMLSLNDIARCGRHAFTPRSDGLAAETVAQTRRGEGVRGRVPHPVRSGLHAVRSV
jgi:CBS domain-containing protein